MRFAKIRDVKSPRRAHDADAGIDFFVPYYDSVDCLSIPPHGDIIINSGIIVNIPKGYALIAKEKSGVCTNRKLLCGASVIDSGYQGEIHIHLINTTDHYIYIKPGEKIVQFLLVPISTEDMEEVCIDNLFQEKSERNTGKFGSTGNE